MKNDLETLEKWECGRRPQTRRWISTLVYIYATVKLVLLFPEKSSVQPCGESYYILVQEAVKCFSSCLRETGVLASLCWGQWPSGVRGGVSEDKRKQTGIVLQERASRLVLRRDLWNLVSYRALLFLIQGESKENWGQKEEAALPAPLQSDRTTCPAATPGN